MDGFTIDPEEIVVLMDYHSGRMAKLDDYTIRHMERAKYWSEQLLKIKAEGEQGQEDTLTALQMARR